MAPSFTATTQLGVHYSVLKLYSWPELYRFPPELVLDTARVCALLAIRPTGAPLISTLLALPRERVAYIVEVLHLQGHLDEDWCDAEDERQSEFDAISSGVLPSTSSTLLGRLWKRLLGLKG